MKQETKSRSMEVLFKWIMFTAAITGMAMVAGFWPVQGNIPFIVIPSILVLVLGKPVFFERMKLWTLVIMRVLIVFVVFNMFDGQRYVNIILWMLVINILEATFTDLLKHKQILNAISGFALAIGVFALSGVWVSDAPVGMYYLTNGATFAITLMYVIAYTLWNWIFVSYEFSTSVSLMHVGFLLAPIIGSIINSWLGALGGIGFWLLLRANSLAIGGWMQIGNKAWFEQEYHLDWFEKFINWTHKKSVQTVFMIINVGLIVALMIMANGAGKIAFPKIF